MDMTSFNLMFKNSKKVEFNPSWANNTGYFDGVISAKHDVPVCFMDNFNRRAVVIPFSDTVLVVNERYSEKDTIVYCFYNK